MNLTEVDRMPNVQLARNLRYLRKQNNLTQEALSDLLNISRQAYSNYETCKRIPDLDTLLRLSRYYHISLDDMILEPLPFPSSSSGIMKDTKTLYYTSAKSKSTGNSVYLKEEELDLIMDFRSLSPENKQIITGLLSNFKSK